MDPDDRVDVPEAIVLTLTEPVREHLLRGVDRLGVLCHEVHDAETRDDPAAAVAPPIAEFVGHTEFVRTLLRVYVERADTIMAPRVLSFLPPIAEAREAARAIGQAEAVAILDYLHAAYTNLLQRFVAVHGLSAADPGDAVQ